jgi:hypothetical protein
MRLYSYIVAEKASIKSFSDYADVIYFDDLVTIEQNDEG